MWTRFHGLALGSRLVRWVGLAFGIALASWVGLAHRSGRTTLSRGGHRGRVGVLVTAAAVIVVCWNGAGILHAAATARHVRTLTAGERFVVRGEGCQPFVRIDTPAEIKIKCVKPTTPHAPAASGHRVNVPPVKTKLTLYLNDKATLRATACNLGVKGGNDRRLVILCTAPED